MRRNRLTLLIVLAIAVSAAFLVMHQTVIANNKPTRVLGNAAVNNQGGATVVEHHAESSRRHQAARGLNWTAAPHLANATYPVGGSIDRNSTGAHVDPNSIFVSVASYRDDQCMPTVEDMYNRALRPESLYLGIVEQHDASQGDPSCVPSKFRRGTHKDACAAKFCPGDNIRVTVIHPKDARGPTFGRYYGMLMYRGEKFFMMIDSHNRFVTHWDDIVVNMYRGLGVNKGVLSHYPEAWNNPDDKKETNAPLDTRPTTTYLCTAKFIDFLGYVRLDGFVVPRRAQCRPQPWAAAGFLFADAKLVSEVPFDPNLDYIFDGEEILYSARMWTSGWDIFSPSRNILYHYYYRTNAKKFWGGLPPGWGEVRDAAQRRIQRLLRTVHKGTDNRMVAEDTKELQVIKDIDKFGLGTARTLDAWYAFAGIDKKHYKLTRNFCQEYP